MQKTTTKTTPKYDVDIIKMVRNNNIPIGREALNGYNTYFMLDYFDLLFHKTLTGKDKIYTEFWNIRNSHIPEKKSLNYKAAYRTLSLYAQDGVNGGLFDITADENADALSNTPFLGIIQINLIYTVFDKELLTEDTLPACEQKILEHLKQNGAGETSETRYRMHRSSTSGDLCLVTKCASVEKIYQISALINQLIICHHDEYLKFSTYTNVGIECRAAGERGFLSFREDTIIQNEKCEFALRITSEHPFAKELIQKLQMTKEKESAIKPMEGLFGRYDFLLQLSMEEFSQIYSVLCTSKIIGYPGKTSDSPLTDDNSKTWLHLFMEGIVRNEIQIINERVLVPLSATIFEPENSGSIPQSACQQLENVEYKLKSAVRTIGEELITSMGKFQELESIFLEERRVFIDVSRELSEVISTYVPQGMDNDSHVNWQLLISDLQVAFSYITKWREAYGKCGHSSDQKAMRVQFLNDIRLITDAINQYYKLLQNVNAQTWQSPLYEIQTQLDSEKMMIAYREFLYEYFFDYKERHKETKDPRPMLFPIVYPDMTIDIACANAVFQNIKELTSQLLICRVPSFEYYGRMFDMIPWILHEASHSVRTLNREDRNRYLIRTVMENIFNQVLYKIFNKYSNDFGYHKLGTLENNILDIIVEAAVSEFEIFCKKNAEDMNHIEINFLESELLEFLLILFDQDIFQMEEGEDNANVNAIQTALCHFLASLGILDAKITVRTETGDIEQSAISLVSMSRKNGDAFSKLLELIYNTYYEQLSGMPPAPDKWLIIREDNNLFESNVETELAALQKLHINEDVLREYCFTIRELNRLYKAWYKRKKDTPDETHRIHLWEQCYLKIQAEIEDAFTRKKGFTELYRILNMLFSNHESSAPDNIQKISQTFNILLQEEVHALVDREVTIYRESYADLYMAAALNLSAFGYCRQISQTTSDASIENYVKWSESINAHRFRAVTAILLMQESLANNINSIDNQIYIPIETLLEQGKTYCHSSLQCTKQSILGKIESNKKQEAITKTFTAFRQNINYIFQLLKQGDSVSDYLEDSLLSVFLKLDETADAAGTKVNAARQKAVEFLEPVQEELTPYRHVIHRIICFIALLDLISEKGKIILTEYEFDHLNSLYEVHDTDCRALQEEAACKTVADFYNTPQSAVTKSPEEMLDDTIQFIETYYYRNRFKVMSSDEIKEEIK